MAVRDREYIDVDALLDVEVQPSAASPKNKRRRNDGAADALSTVDSSCACIVDITPPVHNLRRFFTASMTAAGLMRHVREQCTELPQASFWNMFTEKVCVGEGSYGMVWKCTTQYNEVVAVKSCPINLASPHHIEDSYCSVREVAILRFLQQHRVPNVLRIHQAYFSAAAETVPSGHDTQPKYSILTREEINESTGTIFMVLSIASRDLCSMVSTRVAPDVVRTVGTSIGSALAQMHAIGLVHLDVKPSNILCMPNGAYCLADFGNTRPVGPKYDDVVRGVVGTYEYMDPEALKSHDSSRATDCWSLGATLAELSNGAPLIPTCQVKHRNSTDHAPKCYVVASRNAAGSLIGKGNIAPVVATLLALNRKDRRTCAEVKFV